VLARVRERFLRDPVDGEVEKAAVCSTTAFSLRSRRQLVRECLGDDAVSGGVRVDVRA
jgi:hypothetical protein